jgi:hypothetical protein
MDCRTARLLLEFARPALSELPPSDGDALEEHLAGCTDCDALARAEREADARLGQAMRTVPLPDGLRDRILSRLEADRADQRRRRIGWVVRLAAAAAILFVACWFAFTWIGRNKPELDLQEVLFENGNSVTYRTRESVERDLKAPAPAAFNYAFLNLHGTAYCQGKPVPVLIFQRRDTEARVYVVSSDQFNLANLESGEAVDSGGYHVAVMRDEPDHAFVIVYKGDSLQPLLNEDSEAR